MKTPRRRGRGRSARGRRAASRRERREDGSTASTATVRPRARHARTSSEGASTCPAPGGPVTPTTCAGRLAAERGGGDLAQQRADLLARLRRAVLDEVQDLRRGAEVALAQAASERRAVREGHARRDASASGAAHAPGRHSGSRPRRRRWTWRSE